MSFIKWMLNWTGNKADSSAEKPNYAHSIRGFANLPDDVLQRIFWNLQPVEVSKYRLVCHSWNRNACSVLNQKFQLLCEQADVWNDKKFRSYGMNRILVDIEVLKVELGPYIQAGNITFYFSKLLHILNDAIKMVQIETRTSISVFNLTRVLNQLSCYTDDAVEHFEIYLKPRFHSCHLLYHKITLDRLRRRREALRRSSTDILHAPRALQTRFYQRLSEKHSSCNFKTEAPTCSRKLPRYITNMPYYPQKRNVMSRRKRILKRKMSHMKDSDTEGVTSNGDIDYSCSEKEYLEKTEKLNTGLFRQQDSKMDETVTDTEESDFEHNTHFAQQNVRNDFRFQNTENYPKSCLNNPLSGPKCSSVSDNISHKDEAHASKSTDSCGTSAHFSEYLHKEQNTLHQLNDSGLYSRSSNSTPEASCSYSNLPPFHSGKDNVAGDKFVFKIPTNVAAMGQVNRSNVRKNSTTFCKEH